MLILKFKILQRISLCFPGCHVFITLILPEYSESLNCSCMKFFLIVILALIFFKINMTILYVCMDMHYMGTWSSEWSKGLINPENEKMESCECHVSTGKCVHLIQDLQGCCIILPSLQLCVRYLWPTFIFQLFSSVHL